MDENVSNKNANYGSLSSIVKWFAELVKHCVDYLDKKNHNFKQHLIQGITGVTIT